MMWHNKQTLKLCGLCVFAGSLMWSALNAADKINLGGRKDKVLRPSVRGDVLAAANLHLSKHDDGKFDELLVQLENPYTFEKKGVEKVEPVEVVEKVEPVKPKVKVIYDDAAVLNVVAANFVKQIHGTMGMGGTYYLQYGQHRKLMKAGTQFPVRVPEAREEPFKITLAAVNEDDFSLQLGDVVRSFSYEDEKLSKGAIQVNDN